MGTMTVDRAKVRTFVDAHIRQAAALGRHAPEAARAFAAGFDDEVAAMAAMMPPAAAHAFRSAVSAEIERQAPAALASVGRSPARRAAGEMAAALLVGIAAGLFIVAMVHL